MARVGEAFVDIRPNLDGFEKSLSKGVGDATQKAGQQISRAGGTLTKTVTGPIVGVGTAAIVAAQSVESAFRDIRVGTGATGETLEQLNADFDAIARDSSASIGRVGTVVADLNTRLGLTGQPMQDLAGQVLNLESILGGTEVSLDTLTRVFGAFQVQPEEYAETLDRLFRASQATGVEFNDLQGLLVSQSAAFGELGFGIDETVAILGQFEKAGVNTETVLAGLRANIVKAAGEGKSAAEFFRDGVKTIEDFIAEGDEAGAQAAAKELFGARTFLDALDAIKRGEFNIEDTLEQITDGGDTINQLADDTLGFTHDFQKFKNQMTLSLAPLGEKLIPMLTRAMESIIPFVIDLVDRFANMDPTLQKVIGVVLGVLAALGPVLIVVGKVVVIVGKLIGVFGFLLNPVTLIIGGIALLTAGVILAYQRFETFRKVVDNVISFVVDLVQGFASFFVEAFEVVKDVASSVWDAIKVAAEFAFETIKTVIEVVVAVVTTIFEVYKTIALAVWEAITTAAEVAWTVIQTAIEVAVAVITTVFETYKAIALGIWDAIKIAAEVAWRIIRTTIETAINVVTTVFEVYRSIVLGVWEAIQAGAEFAWGVIRAAIETVIRIVTRVIEGYKRIVTGVWDAIKVAGEFVFGVLQRAWENMTNNFTSAFEFVRDFVVGAFEGIRDVGTEIFGTLADLITGTFDRAIRGSRRIINGFIRATNVAIRGLNVVPGVNIPQISELANGAIVTRPTLALVGEAGPEAVIPLTRPARAAQLMDEAGLSQTTATRSVSGPIVSIETATFVTPMDAEAIAQKINAGILARAS